jgi:hypothetical protein
MASDDRLIRLGLAHLAKKPKELAAALAKLASEAARAEAEIEAEMIALRAKLGVSEGDAEIEAPRSFSTGMRSRRNR